MGDSILPGVTVQGDSPSYIEESPQKSDITYSWENAEQSILPGATVYDQGEDDRRKEGAAAMLSFLQNAEDPEFEQRKFQVAESFAQISGTDPAYVYENMEMVARTVLGEEAGVGDFVDHWRGYWSNSKAMVELSDLHILKATQGLTQEQEARIEYLKDNMTPEFYDENKSWLTRFFYSGMEGIINQVPIWTRGFMRGFDEAAAFGAAGATMAAVGGQAGPQIATPEELATVPAGFAIGVKAGFAASSAKEYARYATGLNYMAFTEEGMDPNLAFSLSMMMGGTESLLEIAQLDEAAKFLFSSFGQRKVARAAARGIQEAIKSPAFNTLVKKYSSSQVFRSVVDAGTFMAEEAAQEAIQEFSNVIGERVGRSISTLVYDEPMAQDTVGEDIQQITEAFTQSLSMFGLMAFPKTTIQVGAGITSDVRAAYQKYSDGMVMKRETAAQDNAFEESEGTQRVPIDLVKNGEYSDESYSMAGEKLAIALEGNGKLPPVQVVDRGDGQYRVIDGNATVQRAYEMGMNNLVVQEVPLPDVFQTEAIQPIVNEVARERGGSVKHTKDGTTLILENLEDLADDFDTFKMEESEDGMTLVVNTPEGLSSLNVKTPEKYIEQEVLQPIIQKIGKAEGTEQAVEAIGAAENPVKEYNKRREALKKTTGLNLKKIDQKQILKDLKPPQDEVSQRNEGKAPWQQTAAEYAEMKSPEKKVANETRQEISRSILEKALQDFFWGLD